MARFSGIDHVVIVVPDLGPAKELWRSLGFTVLEGGRHPGAGTENALMPLRDGTYLELFTFSETRPEHSLWPVFEQGGGLGQYWFRSSSIEDDMAKVRDLVPQYNGPRAGSRTAADGQKVEFRLSSVRATGGAYAPCLIEDVTPANRRVPAPVAHANGAVGLRAIVLVLDALEEPIQVFTRLLGASASAGQTRSRGVAGATFRLGQQEIRLRTPRPADGERRGLTEVVLESSARSSLEIGGKQSGGVHVLLEGVRS
jgi:hypothetical protein